MNTLFEASSIPKRGRGRPKGSGERSGSYEYRIWQGMKARCLNPKRDPNGGYAKRGIKVCDRWLSFDNFLADMGRAPAGMSLDRIDSAGNYEPANCRWATRDEQVNNMRCNRMVLHEGKPMTVAQYARAVGEDYGTAYRRLVRSGNAPRREELSNG